MDVTTHNTVTRVFAVLLLAALAAMLALVSGCPQDDSAQMAQQMGAGRQSSTSNRKSTNTGTASREAPSGMATMAGAGEEGADSESPAGDGTEPAGDEPAAEGEYAGPKVMIEDFQVKAPYPEFNGEGRYDLSFTVELEEATPPSVWEIRALDENGEVVGSLEQFLSLSYGWKKPLDFKALYCSHMPSSVEIRLTDKQPEQAGAEEVAASKGSGGRNSSSGGGGGGRSGMGMAGGGDEEDEDE